MRVENILFQLDISWKLFLDHVKDLMNSAGSRTKKRSNCSRADSNENEENHADIS